MKETQTCLSSIALEMHALVGNPVVESVHYKHMVTSYVEKHSIAKCPFNDVDY